MSYTFSDFGKFNVRLIVKYTDDKGLLLENYYEKKVVIENIENPTSDSYDPPFARFLSSRNTNEDGTKYESKFVPQEEEKAEIIIGKHRNGPIGTVDIVFQKQYTRFVDDTQEPQTEIYTDTATVFIEDKK